MAGVLDTWRERRQFKRAVAEGRHLASDARRILRKKSNRIPDSAANEIEQAIGAFEVASRSGDFDKLRESLTLLDERVDKHLAFARKSTIREYAESIGVAVAIALLLRAFVVEAFQIPSGSMIPTLEIGDHIFVAKFSYGISVPFTNAKILKWRQPERGDVIVFKFPNDPEIDYIKRVVGLPGDKIEIRANEIFVNGRAMPREHVAGDCRYSEGGAGLVAMGGAGAREGNEAWSDERRCDLWIETLDGKEHKAIFDPGRIPSSPATYEVPEGRVFVMGDNRDNSNDSRSWGTVPLDYIKGKALIVWWSRAPVEGGDGAAWFKSIRFSRFFTAVR